MYAIDCKIYKNRYIINFLIIMLKYALKLTYKIFKLFYNINKIFVKLSLKFLLISN